MHIYGLINAIWGKFKSAEEKNVRVPETVMKS